MPDQIKTEVLVFQIFWQMLMQNLKGFMESVSHNWEARERIDDHKTMNELITLKQLYLMTFVVDIPQQRMICSTYDFYQLLHNWKTQRIFRKYLNVFMFLRKSWMRTTVIKKASVDSKHCQSSLLKIWDCKMLSLELKFFCDNK